MFQHLRPQHSHHSRHSSEDTVFGGSEPFNDSSTPYTSESYALLQTPSPTGSLFPQKDSSLGQLRVEEKQKDFSLITRYMSPYYVTPITVLVVQTVLLVVSWTFFAITLTTPVPLSVENAIGAKLHMQSVTMVMTLIASTISLVSSVLYANALRYALARLLATKVSLFAVFGTIKMSNSGPILNFTRPTWTIMSLLCAIAINAQTAGYTTLLTPKLIVVKSNMVGYELDLKSVDFQQLMKTNVQRVTADMFSRVISVAEASGATAISSRFSLPSILNFSHFSYLNSTHGILPVLIDEMNSKILTECGRTIPVNVRLEQKWATPPGFPVRFSMSQQGFTAQVTCQKRKLDETTSPSLVIRWGNDTLFNTNVTLAQLEVVCPTDTQSSFSEPILASANIDAVFAVPCSVNEMNGRRRWDLILKGSGIYESIESTICSIYPKVHALTIDYNDNSKLFNSTIPNFINGTEPPDGEDAPWLGDFALSVFLSGLNVGQSRTRNAMGDTILSFISELTLPNSTDVLSDVLAQYVRGVLELSGTFLRTVYTQDDNGLYPGGDSAIPPSMRIPTNGTYAATTVGWHQATEISGSMLLAPTVVSLLSIIIVVATLISKGRNKEPDANRYFDPGDILHVISAASAGGMQTRFPPFHENSVDQCEDVMITLAPVNGDNSRSGFVNVN